MNNRCTLLILSVGITISSLYGCTAFTTTNPSLTSKGIYHNINKSGSVGVSHTNNNNSLHHQTFTTATSSRRDVSLSMGIRSFIKRKILRKGEGIISDDNDLTDDNDNGVEEEKEDVTLRSILQSESPSSTNDDESSIETTADDDDDTSSINSMKSKLKSKIKSAKDKVSGKDTAESNTPSSSDQYVNDILTKNNNIPYETEDTKQRIKRMKSGTGMTEEEKQSFLTNALTRTLPKSKPRGPPIRQEIPGMDTKSSGGGVTKKSGGEKDKKSTDTSSSSAAATTSPLDIIMDGKMKNEDAKRRYMESITNPDRFATFSTYQQQPGASADMSVVGEEDIVEASSDEIEPSAYEETEEDEEEIESSAEDTASADFAQMKRQIAEDRELLNPAEKQEQSAARDAVESILSMISANNDKKAESKDNDDDTAAGTNKTKSKDDHLAARLGKAAMEQEKRDAEARAAAEKKKADEKRRYAELQKQREEEAERRETERMEKARAVAEKARRREEEVAAAQRRELEARQAAQDEYWAKQLKKDTARKERSEPVDITRKKEVMARDSIERMEREVAKDAERAKIREEERAREDPHEGEILKEAAERKMKDRELVRDIEAQSAARISNTVPRKSKEDASVSAFVREQQKKKEEIDRLRKLDEESLKSLNSPLPSPGRPPVGISPSPYQALDNIPASPPPAPVPVVKSSATPDLSLASLTMSKKSESAPEPTTSSPPPAPAERLNLFEMTKLKDDAASLPAVKKNPPPKKRIVRQQVLLDDDDEDDDSMLSGAPGLTIADALKKERKKGGGSGPGGKDMSANDKAKAWGIDMSKFT